MPCAELKECENLGWYAEAPKKPSPRLQPQRPKRSYEKYYLRRVKRSPCVAPPITDELVSVQLECRFRQLADAWVADTWHVSSPTDLVSHPAYRQIIHLGWAAVPYMLQDLQRTGRFWFPALHEITGLRPFDPKYAGNTRRMTDAWVEWGKKKELI